MSNGFADKLNGAKTLDDFLKGQDIVPEWRIVAALKEELDQLIGSDLRAATRLAGSIGKLAEHLGDPISKGLADVSRARVLHFSGEYREADALYENAITVLRAARLTAETSTIYIHRVLTLTQMGRYQEAIRLARSARRLIGRDKPIKMAQLETNVGNIYYRLDRYNQALKHYDRAYELFHSAGEKTMLAFVDYSCANIYAEIDRPDEAQVLLQRAAAAWDGAGRSLLAAQALYNLSYLQFQRGNYNTALSGYYQARDRVAELGSTPLAAWCDLEIAEVLFALNAFDDAAASAARARAHFSALNIPYEAAKAGLTRALALMGLRQFAEAQDELTAAREQFRASGNTTFTAQVDAYLAELALKSGNTEEAARRAASALPVFVRQNLSVKSAYLRLLKARAAYQKGERSNALRLARSSLKTVKALFVPGIAYQCHHLIGCLERDKGRRQAALENLRRAVKTIEQMRGGIAADELKATFLRDKIEIYEDAIAACLEDGSPSLIDEAFQLVESSKSRALADLLARYAHSDAEGDLQSQTGKANAATRARLAKLIEELNWYSSQAGLEDEKGDQRRADVASRYRHAVLRCEGQIAKLYRRMEIEDPTFAQVYQGYAATVADLRRALQAGEVAIEYFTTGDEVSAFIVTREGMRVARAITSKRELEQRLKALHFQIEKFTYGPDYINAHFWQLKAATDQCLAGLYEAIFAPLEGMLDGDELIVIPHDTLHYAPFQALCDRRGYYLIDRFAISYAPSAAVLKLCRAKQNGKRSGSVVAMGVAEAGTPHIEDEIRSLLAIFPDAVTLFGKEATQGNLMRLAPQARFLHLASHGYFRRDNPMFSFLKLADARLHFYSLLDLRLNAEMVTLSACQTGVNTIFPGDELHGLTRGFLYAGAPTLVVSLWEVNDGSTAELMREMYSQIRAGVSKRTALRNAQLAIKDAYGHPYYWAPFVLMGNPG